MVPRTLLATGMFFRRDAQTGGKLTRIGKALHITAGFGGQRRGRDDAHADNRVEVLRHRRLTQLRGELVEDLSKLLVDMLDPIADQLQHL